MESTSCSPSAGAGPSITTPLASSAEASPAQQQLALLDMFFPGFSVLSSAVQRYTRIDLNIYIPVLLLVGGSLFVWQYFSEYTWRRLDSYLMSRCSLRTDDEAYNYVMAWIAKQRFSLRSRRFIVNTNTDSRSWFTWKWRDENEDNDDEYEGDEATRKPLSYTPDFGSHYFFYKSRLLIFHRSQNRDQPYSVMSQKEEISISCFGRDPSILKELLIEARDLYLKRDEKKTTIYRGSSRAGTSEPTWQRCMARTTRPFSTVILDEKVKKDLIDDVTDYLDPATRRWYSNRGIPYRRGYLLYGPPGTGKSSLSLALAGFFKMRIYIVSLSSIHANEETLAALFAELPRRCVVLLEDIDSAGLTHTREDDKADAAATGAATAGPDMVPGQVTSGRPVGPPVGGRLSLSGLLNILDGVASQEGRVLIMTTNHIEKLDKALIRPGRVDMKVHFGRADSAMTAAIFRAIYAPLEGDREPSKTTTYVKGSGAAAAASQDSAEEEKRLAEEAKDREEAVARVVVLAEEFAAKIPAHEFSPAELQGFLMTHKRDPAAAVANAEEWVVATRKEKQQKELEEAEKRRKEEEERAAEQKKKKEEEAKEEAAKKEKEEKEARKRKESRRRRKASRKSRRRDRDGSSSDSSDSSDESDDEKTTESKKRPAADAVVEEPRPLMAVEVNGEKKAPTADVKAGDSGYET